MAFIRTNRLDTSSFVLHSICLKLLIAEGGNCSESATSDCATTAV